MNNEPIPPMPLHTIVTLMRFAAENLNISHFQWLPPSNWEKGIVYDKYIIRLNHLCKEALPWITRVAELKTENDILNSKWDEFNKRLAAAEERNEFLQECLDRVFP
jgi:hypothetical protein